MKTKIYTLFLITLIFFACEKDDFCIQNPVTPQLILRFYDQDNRETTKSIEELYVWAEGKDSLYNNVAVDSIAIPLNSIATETIYNLSDGTNTDQFTIKYTPREEYVSRSCGFKIIFDTITFSSSNTWIKDFTPSELTVINTQNTAHVQVFH